MKRILKWAIMLLGVIVIAVVALVAYVYIASARLMARIYAVDVPRVTIPADAASLARGKYLPKKLPSAPIAMNRISAARSSQTVFRWAVSSRRI